MSFFLYLALVFVALGVIIAAAAILSRKRARKARKTACIGPFPTGETFK